MLDSIKYHICDVFLEELDKVATSLHLEEDGSTKVSIKCITPTYETLSLTPFF